MEFLIQPQPQPGIFGINIVCSGNDNVVCPENGYQCGCNTAQGCACPKT